jgi:hypothetical protein
MVKDDHMDKLCLGWWKRQGFEMVFVYVDKRATFVGWHAVCKEGEPTGFVCPDLPRALIGAGVSCSTTILAAAKCGNMNVVRDIAAAGAMARAADFAGLLPIVSRKFYQYAMDVKRSRDIVDREMSMHVSGEEGHMFSEISDTIESQNLGVTPTDEYASLQALCLPATWEELDTFMLKSWTFEGIGDYDDHCASLPMSWRP